jgi:hypothetical protein
MMHAGMVLADDDNDDDYPLYLFFFQLHRWGEGKGGSWGRAFVCTGRGWWWQGKAMKMALIL